MAASGTQIILNFNRLKQRRYNFDARWEAMAPFIAPSREGIITERPVGYTQTRGVYDSTSMMAAEMMAMFIAGHIINPSQQWVGLTWKDPNAEEDDEGSEWLEECRDITLRRASASLFYAEGPESLIDYGGFGTGFLLCEEAPQPINRTIGGFRGFYFKAEKTGRFIIDEGADGLVDTAYREFKLSCRVISDIWGHLPGALSEKVKSHIQTGRGDEMIKIIHAIYPRPKSEQSGAGSTSYPWASCWVEFDSKHLIHESGYKTFPAAVPRYHKTPGEIYGRGRGDLAFPDTWTLNTAKRMGLEDWALKIRPPIITRSDSVIGTLRLTPGGPTVLNTHGQRVQDVIMPFETGGKPEVSHIKEEELRQSIREIFFVDQIRQLMQVEKSEMTAFEFAKKLELLFRLMGPVYGRLEWEYLYRIVSIMFNVQIDAGGFPPPPQSVFRGTGRIDIEFQNPIAKAQKAGDMEALAMAINDLAPFAQSNPDILDRFDPDVIGKQVPILRGVPLSWLRDDEEFKKLKDAKHAQNMQENALAQAEQAGGALGKAAPALKMLPGGKPGMGLPAGINMPQGAGR